MKKFLHQIPGYNLGKKVYYFSSRVKHRLRNNLIPTARILLYHRIAKIKDDPYQLAVSPDNFREHLKYLKDNFRIIPLAQLVDEIKARKIVNGTIVIAFDDGYADNLHHATPTLKELNLPAAIFITINSNSSTDGQLLNNEEIRTLSELGLIEIGSHTLNHPRLSKISTTKQEKEISESKNKLQSIINRSVNSFAYPFGDKKSFTKDTINLVKKAGYHYACANIHERVTSRSDIYAMPRYVVRNWDLEEFKKQLKNFI